MTNTLATLPWRSRAPLLQNGERLMRCTNGHWIQYVPPILVTLLLSAAATALYVAAYSFVESAPGQARIFLFLALIVSLAVCHWFFHFALSEHVSDILLTNKRLLRLERRLWLFDGVDETVLVKIKVVDVKKRGFLRQIFNYGDLWFDTSGGVLLRYVPDPKGWAEDIQRQIH